jgi:acyl-[acyl-carrier-protein]-phospholipid O-acyltransferase/long-chain-fatty-acid--[acyl-carrier-protein] ligase
VRRARRRPFALSLCDGAAGRELSRIGGLTAAIGIARALRATWSGEERVGVLLPPSVAGAVTNLALSLAGKTSVNLNFTTGPAGMASASRQAALRSVITSREFLEKAKVALPDGVRPVWIEEVLPKIERKSSLALALLAPVRWIESACGDGKRTAAIDVATVIFSSGSTGEPKGVELTHGNIASNVRGVTQIMPVEDKDRLLGLLPLFHSFGYLSVWFALQRGMALVCHPSPLDAPAIGAIVERYQVTILIATPTFLQLYSRRCTPENFGSLRVVLTGAEKLPQRLVESFALRFGVRPFEGYGASECAPVIATSTLDFRAAGFFQPGSRAGSVGRPLPGVAVRFVDPDSGAEVAAGEPGLLLVRGPNVMKGYLGRPDLTAAAMRDGWYVTGDLARCDEDGFLFVTDRLSRFSKIGGEMVPHGRVEDALHEAAGLVTQSFAVAGVPDEKKGERLVVLHTLDEQKIAEVLGRLQGMGLPNLFIPRREHFVHVPTLPVLGTGKLDLRAVKKLALELASSSQVQ